jgi:hypothetical protein
MHFTVNDASQSADAHNGVLAAVGETGGPLRPDETVRRGLLAEWNTLDLAAS